MTLTILYLAVLFIIGAAVGSFISVLVYRLHHGKSGIVKGRSKCPKCDANIPAKDLIPLLSYIALRGKCRDCNKDISFLYPLIELVTGGLFVVLFLKFTFVDENLVFDGGTSLLYAFHAVIAFILSFTFFFDLKYKHVADEMLIPGILLALLATLIPGQPNILDALLGLSIPVALFGVQYILSRGAWIGAGDLRVGALMGILLGWQLVIVALIFSYVAGSIISIFVALRTKKIRGVQVPFAPFLVTGTYLALFFGEGVIQWYLVLLGVGG
jgi:leader peptidase (prepilin peptidase) / N-methyltransferase